MQSLAEARTGESCTIKWMFGNSQVLEIMRRLNIKEGSTIDVIHSGKDGLIIGRDSARLAIGSEVGGRIFV